MKTVRDLLIAVLNNEAITLDTPLKIKVGTEESTVDVENVLPSDDEQALVLSDQAE